MINNKAKSTDKISAEKQSGGAIQNGARGGGIFYFECYDKDGGAAICVLDFGSDKTSTATFQVQFPANTNTSALIRIS